MKITKKLLLFQLSQWFALFLKLTDVKSPGQDYYNSGDLSYDNYAPGGESQSNSESSGFVDMPMFRSLAIPGKSADYSLSGKLYSGHFYHKF
jgi:hypothetical protein